MKQLLRSASSPSARVAALVVAAALAGRAVAQWSSVSLNPTGATHSSLAGGAASHQVGDARLADIAFRASLWTSPTAWVDLSPPGARRSYAHAIHNGQQVGWVRFGFVSDEDRASLWSGSADSWIDLTPPSASGAQAYGVHEGQQVGFVHAGGIDRASLWRGSSTSWVDLNPAGATGSRASGIHSGVQVGRATIGGVIRAGMWRGTAASWVDLHPTGPTVSRAFATHADEQVGEAFVSVPGQYHASLWRGSASSWIDLHPPGAIFSHAYGVHNGRQVGHARIDGVEHASLWTGSPESRVDLHAFAPPGFTSTFAHAIWDEAGFTYVAGNGFNSRVGRNEALLWWHPLAPCPADFNLDGTLDFFDYDDFVACFEGTACPPGADADFNHDGTPDFFDYDDFAAAFEAGCP